MGRGSSRRGYRWITDDVGPAWLGKPERAVRISRAFFVLASENRHRSARVRWPRGVFDLFWLETTRFCVNRTGMPDYGRPSGECVTMSIDRRKFLKSSLLATTGAIASPYIISSP